MQPKDDELPKELKELFGTLKQSPENKLLQDLNNLKQLNKKIQNKYEKRT